MYVDYFDTTEYADEKCRLHENKTAKKKKNAENYSSRRKRPGENVRQSQRKSRIKKIKRTNNEAEQEKVQYKTKFYDKD